MRLISALIFLLILTGCETTRSFLGISTKEIEKTRPNAITKVFNLDYRTSLDKTEAALKKLDAYIYVKKTGMLACYRSSKDTTPVGIFFKEIDANNTQIEVSSPSSVVRDELAGKLFQALLEEKS